MVHACMHAHAQLSCTIKASARSGSGYSLRMSRLTREERVEVTDIVAMLRDMARREGEKFWEIFVKFGEQLSECSVVASCWPLYYITELG